MSQRNKWFVAGIVVLFICTGFFREFVFLNWNEQMRVTYYHSPDPHVAPSMQWLGSFSYATLYWIKWPLTLLFSVVFGLYTLLAVHLSFANRQYTRITLLTYAALFVASFLFFAFGWMFGARDACYEIARFLAGLIETPAILIVLMASFMIHRRL